MWYIYLNVTRKLRDATLLYYLKIDVCQMLPFSKNFDEQANFNSEESVILIFLVDF